jgi:hypothetical protein
METSFTSSNDGQVAVWQLQGSTCVNLFGSGVPASDSPCRIRLQISLKSLTLEKCTIETQVAYLCYHGWRLFLVPKCFQRRWIDLVWTQKKFGRESWLQRLRLGQVCDKQTHDNSMEWGSSLRSSFYFEGNQVGSMENHASPMDWRYSNSITVEISNWVALHECSC